jgi:hypothetical protein
MISASRSCDAWSSYRSRLLVSHHSFTPLPLELRPDHLDSPRDERKRLVEVCWLEDDDLTDLKLVQKAFVLGQHPERVS